MALTPTQVWWRSNLQRLEIGIFYLVTLFVFAWLIPIGLDLIGSIAGWFPTAVWATLDTWLGWLFRPIWHLATLPVPVPYEILGRSLKIFGVTLAAVLIMGALGFIFGSDTQKPEKKTT